MASKQAKTQLAQRGILSYEIDQYIKTEADKLAYEKGIFKVDLRKSDKIQQFAEQFCFLSDGENAGKPANFRKWFVTDVLIPQYAFIRKDNGLRLKKRGSIWTPRKCQKTTALAVLTLWQIMEEPAAEVFIVSSSIKAADNMFKMCRNFIDNSTVLSKYFHVQRHTRTISGKRGTPFYKSAAEVLSSEKTGKSGQGASCVFFDELGEVNDSEVWERLYNSGAKRKQAIWLSISTPQYTKFELALTQWNRAKDILSGKDDTSYDYLASIHGVPLVDEKGNEIDWRNEDNWWKYLEPTLGTECINRDYWRQEYQDALKSGARSEARFRNHLLGQYVSAIGQWLPDEKISAATKPIDLEQLRGKKCYIGADGAVSQLSSIVCWFPEQQIALPFFFHPEKTATKSDENQGTTYTSYEKSEIKLTDGDIFDWQVHKDKILELCNTYDVQSIGFDPTNLEGRVIEIQNDVNCEIVAVTQNTSQISPALKRIERMFLDGSIQITDNRLFANNFRSCVMQNRNDEQIFIDRDKSTGRYDGVSALACAVNRALADEEENSVYDDFYASGA